MINRLFPLQHAERIHGQRSLGAVLKRSANTVCHRVRTRGGASLRGRGDDSTQSVGQSARQTLCAAVSVIKRVTAVEINVCQALGDVSSLRNYRPEVLPKLS